MSITAKSYRGDNIGEVTIAQNCDEEGKREVFEATAHVPIGKLGKTESGLWISTTPKGVDGYHETRGRALGQLFEVHRNGLRRRTIEAAQDAAELAAEQMIANAVGDQDVEIGRLFQDIYGRRSHEIDHGYNPAGRDAIVLGTDEKLHRVKLTGYIHRAEAPAADRFAITDGEETGSVVWGLVIPDEIIEAEQAREAAAANRVRDEAIARVEKFLQARAIMPWMDDEPIQEISGNHSIRKLMADDLRIILEAARQA